MKIELEGGESCCYNYYKFFIFSKEKYCYYISDKAFVIMISFIQVAQEYFTSRQSVRD